MFDNIVNNVDMNDKIVEIFSDELLDKILDLNAKLDNYYWYGWDSGDSGL